MTHIRASMQASCALLTTTWTALQICYGNVLELWKANSMRLLLYVPWKQECTHSKLWKHVFKLKLRIWTWHGNWFNTLQNEKKYSRKMYSHEFTFTCIGILLEILRYIELNKMKLRNLRSLHNVCEKKSQRLWKLWNVSLEMQKHVQTSRTLDL